MTNELNVDSELVKQVLKINHLGANSIDIDESTEIGSHIDLVSNGCKIVAQGCRSLDIGHYSLAAGTEPGKCLAQLFAGSNLGRAVAAEVDEADARVLGCIVYRVYGIEYSKLLWHSRVGAYHFKRVGRSLLFCDAQRAEVHRKHSL